MKRFGRTLLTFLMVAFSATPLLAQEEYLAHPSTTLNTGATTIRVFCKPVKPTKGSGTIAVANGVVTATVAQLSLLPSNGTPHATNPYTQTGFYIRTAAGRTLYRAQKASSTTVTIHDGSISGASVETLPTSNPLADGSYTDWGFWSTTCQQAVATTGPRSESVYATIPNLPSLGRLGVLFYSHYRAGALAYGQAGVRCKPDAAGSASGSTLAFSTSTVADGTLGTVLAYGSVVITNSIVPSYQSIRCTVEMQGAAADQEASLAFYQLK